MAKQSPIDFLGLSAASLVASTEEVLPSSCRTGETGLAGPAVDRAPHGLKMSATVQKKTGATVPTARVRQRHRHHVYVVELSDRVWNEPRFRRANPDYRLDRPCVYVGMTGLDPDLRFDKHKAGIKANRFVLEYGLRLLPHLYEVYNPMPYEAARDMEVELAIGLQEAGYGVWQA